MPATLDTSKAISAHSAWKYRLLDAIKSGKSEIPIAKLRLDNECDFGKWFYNLPLEVRQSEQGKKVQKLHATFHVEAARVLELALKGSKAEAAKSLELDSQYAKVSQQLVLALTDWK